MLPQVSKSTMPQDLDCNWVELESTLRTFVCWHEAASWGLCQVPSPLESISCCDDGLVVTRCLRGNVFRADRRKQCACLFGCVILIFHFSAGGALLQWRWLLPTALGPVNTRRGRSLGNFTNGGPFPPLQGEGSVVG